MTQTEREHLIQKYENGFKLLMEKLKLFPEEALKWKPSPEKWSAHEVILHCADSETNAAMRIRYLVSEENPLIVGYDQDLWAKKFDYHSLSIQPALKTIENVRAWTSELIKRFSEEDWNKKGKHTEYGEYSAEKWLELYSSHLEVHANQLERILNEWKKTH
ncbi:MAG: DinB family protein [Ignavibacteria bacterium]|nr:DinB family protein [Ignavibacteria bacterium]